MSKSPSPATTRASAGTKSRRVNERYFRLPPELATMLVAARVEYVRKLSGDLASKLELTQILRSKNHAV